MFPKDTDRLPCAADRSGRHWLRVELRVVCLPAAGAGSTSVVCWAWSGSSWPRSSPPATAPTRRRCQPRRSVCVYTYMYVNVCGPMLCGVFRCAAAQFNLSTCFVSFGQIESSTCVPCSGTVS